MEKITKEELLEKFGAELLSDDDLEKIAGGFSFEELERCAANCRNTYSEPRHVQLCYQQCIR